MLTKKKLSYSVIFVNLFKAFISYIFTLPISIPLPTFQKLWLWDLRTFRWYSIPILHGAVDAMHFRRISTLSYAASTEEQMAEGLLVSRFFIQTCDILQTF
jgi:citrate synthase